jgi:hypothetical protein
MSERKKLTDILSAAGNGGSDWINDNWGDIPPAPDFGSPIPRGSYITHIVEGRLFNASRGTPGYKVTHEVIEGDHRGRRLWHDIWLTGAAKSAAVRDLAKLGITSKQQLEQPIPSRRIRCKVVVVIRKDDQEIERNEVRSFEVLGIDQPQQDPFAPLDPIDTDGNEQTAAHDAEESSGNAGAEGGSDQ